ncbi:hypothetical protein MCUN1_000993 [Malassezia cuniculi]|uniref:Major facilitator superfamily (MFS) profile domain-containing protein n=1 Tax=Malassezia cuniculi TaxID=948313 RepID=A0AAF0ETC4_9BASI|nr:hypothetical protein MCUN1_000993 [Malassezia cuniculi]
MDRPSDDPVMGPAKEKPELALADYALQVEPDAAEQRRVLFKIDLLFLPLASLCVLFQMLDKTLLNYANLLGIQKDTGMNGSEYSWLGTILYLGYLCGTPMHAWFLQHATLSRYVSCVVIIWGAVLMCHAACRSFSGLMAARFFLGFFEAAINPAFILLTGRFYKRDEQVVRVAIWYSMNGWAMIVGSLVTYGILVNPSPYLRMWEELFIAIGAATIGFGVICMLILPSSPDTARHLKPRERCVAVYRIASNQSGIHDSTFKWYQVKEALLDVRLYLFFLAFASVNVTNGGISIFASEIISEFTNEKTRNALLGMCQGASEVVAVAIGTVLFVTLRRRDVPSVFGYLVAITGTAMMTWLDPSMKVSRMAGLALLYFFPISYPMIYSWQSNGVSGTTKRIIFNASLQVAYCLGNAVGPQAFAERDKAGGYLPAKINMLVMYAVSGVFICLISFVHWRWNQSRTEELACDDAEALRVALSDLTDKERPTYKYPY